MLIVCPSCATSHDVEPVSLLPEGRYVRCLRCRMVWHAVPSRADKLLAAAAALGPEPSLAEAMLEAEAQMSQPEPPARAAADMAWSNECAGEVLDDEPPGEGGSFAAADEDEQAAEDGLVLAAADEYDPAAADEIAADEPSEFAEEEAPPIAPVDLDQARLPIEIDEDAPAYSAEPLQAIRSFTARPHLGRARHWSPPRWPMSRLRTGILALLIVDCILVGWRSNVVRAFPQTDSFYKLVGLPVNLRDLAFEAITTMTERHEGVPILVVEGNIVNSARKFVDVPRLKFVVRNAARQEIYSWTAVASRTPLPPGEAVSFRTRLASPPPETHDVVLRFVDRRDVVAAAR
jgi:predicted Zn finger-like uncharacterized protein